MADLNVDLLARVLGRMQSEHDNETLTAARLAIRMVREAGSTWPELLGAGRPVGSGDIIGAHQVIEHQTKGPLAPPVGRTWSISLNWLCARRAGRDDRENRFLDETAQRLARQNGASLTPWISADQAASVIDIYERFASGVPSQQQRNGRAMTGQPAG